VRVVLHAQDGGAPWAISRGRRAAGRRIFTAEFKCGVVQQILKGEKALAEMSRQLDIQPTVIRSGSAMWKLARHRRDRGRGLPDHFGRLQQQQLWSRQTEGLHGPEIDSEFG